MRRATALAITIVVVVSTLAMPLGATVATAQSGPSGMVALGPDQVDEDLPDNPDVPIRASDLEGNVYASDHAGSLQVTITTPERASDHLGPNANVIADDDIAIVLRDDEVHEGRDVAVDVGVLEAGVGYVPEVAYGVHDSGEEWQSPVERDGTVGVFHVPEFSSNSVTFSGGIELSGNAAGDGTNYEYELGSIDGIDQYAINLTGVANSGPVTESGSSTGTKSIDVIGTQEPTGPANGEPQFSASIPDTSTTMIDPDSDSYTMQKTPSGDTQVKVDPEADSGEVTTTVYVNGDQVAQGTYQYYTIPTYDISVSEGDTITVSSSNSKPVEIYEIYYDETYSGTTTVEVGGQSKTIEDSGSVPLDLSTGAQDLSISHTGDGLTSWSLDYDATVETTDPVVEVNGYETEYNGVLSEGETTSLATNEAWLREGTNNVTIRTNTPSNGPESLVDMEYSHDAAGVTKSVDVEATSWTEQFNVSHTFPAEVNDADATLTFDEQVAEIENIEYRTDGGSWQPPPSYELNETDLNVQLGDMPADTTVDVRATGHKVRSYDGDIKVTEPTVEGDALATEVEITDINPDGRFGIRVDDTATGNRLHYASEESWTGESAFVDLASSGTQILRAPDANVGSTMTISTAPISVTPQSGAIEAEVEDASTPTISVRKGNTTGSDRLDVTYYDTVTGNRYVLWSETREVEVDADRAESPVSFVTDGATETYSILQRDEGAGTDPPGPGPIETQDTLPLILVFGGVGGVLVGTKLFGRRFGIGGWLLPATAASVTLIAIHVLAPTSPVTRVAELAYQSNIVTVGAVGLLLVGMWQLDERTSGSVPWYVRGVVGLLSVIWALETLSPGVILGGLRSGVESMGPLIVIVIVGGGAYLIREWIQARRAPDTVVRFSGGNE
ncbi:hypothetical protein [Halorubrum salinum]|uniref:hypothetical protein n=1 Tax=Halorubrum salinum TaxID=767517 RepID=UPI00211360F4|nr:hypothetical protein [Halorubrum salinum]